MGWHTRCWTPPRCAVAILQFVLPEGYMAVWQPDGEFLRPELANRLQSRSGARAGRGDALRDRGAGDRAGQAKACGCGTSAGEIAADRVIVAAGGWISDLVPELKLASDARPTVLCWLPRESREP